MSLSRTITDLGDLAVASGSAAVIAVWLWTWVARTTALVFCACFAGLVAVTTALKVFARSFAPGYSSAHLLRLSPGAPSGHAALAGLIYGGAIVILLRLGRGAGRTAGIWLASGAMAIVAVTRVTLRTHTIGDVVAGFLVSILFLLLLDRSAATAAPVPQGSAAWLLAGLVVAPTLLLASGLRMPSTAVL